MDRSEIRKTRSKIWSEEIGHKDFNRLDGVLRLVGRANGVLGPAYTTRCRPEGLTATTYIAVDRHWVGSWTYGRTSVKTVSLRLG